MQDKQSLGQGRWSQGLIQSLLQLPALKCLSLGAFGNSLTLSFHLICTNLMFPSVLGDSKISGATSMRKPKPTRSGRSSCSTEGVMLHLRHADTNSCWAEHLPSCKLS